MRALTVYLDYGTSIPEPQRGSAGVSFPVKILDAQGTTLTEGVASSGRPTEFKFPDVHDVTVFARLTWPSGKSETQKIDLVDSPNVVTFSSSKIAHNEWSSWAIPRMSSRNEFTSVTGRSTNSIEPYANVWLRIWRFENERWSLNPLVPSMQYKSEFARQVDLALDANPHMLQIGGSDVPWRFVALPGAGPCRLLLTPNDSNDPRSDKLRVTVTGFRTDAETLLEFLARDAMRSASTMVASQEIAFSLFQEKFTDPIAAVAGAYFLLRIEDWQRIPLWWWENLSQNFTWIPDTAILHCVRLLRAGLPDDKAQTEALDLFKKCLDRGWPVYEEGLELLQEASSMLRQIANRQDAEFFSRVDALATAKTWAGAALSFYGREPAKPSAVLWVGKPNAPRRRRLAKLDWADELIDMNLRAVQDTNRITAAKVSRQMSSLAFAQEFSPKSMTRSISSSRSTGQRKLSAGFSFGRYASAAEAAPAAQSIKELKQAKARVQDDWLLLGDIGS